jgi:UDP-N-acetylmuramoyl-tripeptide--D-alanyl-D-alanine ligase
MLLPLLRFWTGPLPKEELFPDRKIRFFIHWFIHPLKRRIAKIYLWYLRRFHHLKVISLTGSVGKTTTTGMIYSILSQSGPTVKTADSITSTYNIPITILKCTPHTRFLILEMGVEYRGDMDFYNWLVTPDIALITGINLTHTSFLGSLESVSAEKSKILKSAPIAVLNADDPYCISIVHPHLYYFGFSPKSDFVRVHSSIITPNLSVFVDLEIGGSHLPVTLPILGSHFAVNAAAAAAVATLLGCTPGLITSGLSEFHLPPHRLQPLRQSSGSLFLDDTYNASPQATYASLDTLIYLARLLNKTPVFVFGQMNELGQYEESSHTEVGEYVRKNNLRYLFTVGPATDFTIKAAHTGHRYPNLARLESDLRHFLRPSHIVLFKSSRSWHMDQLVDNLANT